MLDTSNGARAVSAALLALLALASPVGALQGGGGPEGPARAERVLVLDFQVLDRSVHDEPSAELPRVADAAARMFRERVADDERYTLVTMDRFQEARDRLVSEGSGCADAACSREAARAVGVEHVFRGRVIKVSNLIWYLVVEHEDVASERVVGHEAIELKGQRDVILPRAVAALHRWLLPAG